MESFPYVPTFTDEAVPAGKAQRTDLVIFGCFTDSKAAFQPGLRATADKTGFAATVRSFSGNAAAQRLRRIAKDRKFSAKLGSMVNDYVGEGSKDMLVVGLGDRAKFSGNSLRKVLTGAFKRARSMNAGSISFVPFDIEGTKVDARQFGEAVGLYFGLISYQRKHQKVAKLRYTAPARMQLRLVGAMKDNAEFRKGMAAGRIIADSVNLSRDLGNESPSVCTSLRLAALAEELARDSGGKLTTFIGDENYLQQEGFNAILTVNRGSSVPARLIHIAYVPKTVKATKRIVLVGKGITFDTGGVQIKNDTGMASMQYDMCGAATVIATVQAVARLGLPIEVHAIAPAVANEVDGRSYKPGDIIHTRGGLSIEVGHTDAEGRLILADAFSYAKDLKPDWLIDLATLTGSARAVTGDIASCLFSNNDELREELVASATTAGELVQALQLFRDYLASKNDSFIADVKNDGGVPGAITAANFLCDFAEHEPKVKGRKRGKRKQAWAHFDIAAVGARQGEFEADPRGATGYGVRTLIALFRRLTENK